MTWFLVRVDLCTYFVWYNRTSLMHEMWGGVWHGIERFYGLEVTRERVVGGDARHRGCNVMYVSGGSSSGGDDDDDDDGESLGGASTVEYNGDNVSVEYLSDGYSDGVSIEF